MKQVISVVFGSIEQVKQAALFYDIVIPMMSDDIKTEGTILTAVISYPLDEFAVKVMVDPLKQHFLAQGKELFSYHECIEEDVAIHNICCMIEALAIAGICNGEDVDLDVLGPKIDPLVILQNFGIAFVAPSVDLLSRSATAEDISMIINGIELIDTSKATWEQIYEYRKSEEATRKLRNLRLFFETSYVGKSMGFVEDDFGRRLDDYKEVTSEFGFSTTKSIISMVANSKNLQTFGGIALASIFLGQHFVTAGTMLAGGTFELANIGFEVRDRMHSLNRYKKNHELAYVIDFKNDS